MPIQIHYQQLLDVMPEWIFIDMDGTLVREELTRGCALSSIRKLGRLNNSFNPIMAVYYLARLLTNRLNLKLDLAKRVEKWTYNDDLLRALGQYKGKITLITGSCQELGERVALAANEWLKMHHARALEDAEYDSKSEDAVATGKDRIQAVKSHVEFTKSADLINLNDCDFSSMKTVGSTNQQRTEQKQDIFSKKAIKSTKPMFSLDTSKPELADHRSNEDYHASRYLDHKPNKDCPVFHSVIGSNRKLDCIGLKKLEIMLKLTDNPFYIGNSSQDIPILQNCQGCLITNKPKLIKQLPAGRFFIPD